MSINTKNFYNNAIQGIPEVGGTANIYDTHASPKFPIGTLLERSDGARFRYGQFGATVLQGRLVATDFSGSSIVDTDNSIVASASAQTTTDGTKGSRYIEMTLASITADQLAGAYLITTDDAGEGYTYRIKGNTATNDPASGNIRIELYNPLQNAVTAATDAAIAGNKFADLKINSYATDTGASGVAVVGNDADSYPYGWVQTRGICGVLQDATAASIGEMVVVSGATDGAVTRGVVTTSVSTDAFMTRTLVGQMVVAGDSTGMSVIDLRLE